MAYKNAAGRARPRRRQGGHHRRPGDASRPSRCCGPTAGSCAASAGATSRPATSARTSTDMDVVALESDDVTGRSVANGGAGDSGVLTAFGVHQGMRAAARHRWGAADLGGRRVGIAGVGKVGRAAGGARARATVPRSSSPTSTPAAVERIVAAHPGVRRRRRRGRAGALRHRRLRAVRARWCARRRGRRRAAGGRSCAAAPTTSSSTTGVDRPAGRSAASRTARTTSSTPAG